MCAQTFAFHAGPVHVTSVSSRPAPRVYGSQCTCRSVQGPSSVAVVDSVTPSGYSPAHPPRPGGGHTLVAFFALTTPYICWGTALSASEAVSVHLEVVASVRVVLLGHDLLPPLSVRTITYGRTDFRGSGQDDQEGLGPDFEALPERGIDDVDEPLRLALLDQRHEARHVVPTRVDE